MGGARLQAGRESNDVTSYILTVFVNVYKYTIATEWNYGNKLYKIYHTKRYDMSSLMHTSLKRMGEKGKLQVSPKQNITDLWRMPESNRRPRAC